MFQCLANEGLTRVSAFNLVYLSTDQTRRYRPFLVPSVRVPWMSDRTWHHEAYLQRGERILQCQFDRLAPEDQGQNVCPKHCRSSSTRPRCHLHRSPFHLSQCGRARTRVANNLPCSRAFYVLNKSWFMGTFFFLKDANYSLPRRSSITARSHPTPIAWHFCLLSDQEFASASPKK